MTSILFKKEQNEIFKKQLEDNNEEIKVWNIVNVIVPSIIISIPVIFFYFIPEDRATFQNLILNGSFSLLGINILFSMSIFLINSIKLKDVKIEKQIHELRTRLVVYLCVLLIFGTIIYLLQIAYVINSIPQITTLLIGFILVLLVSIGVGKRIFLIKDELVGKSYNEDIQDTVKNLRQATDDLD